MSTTSSPFGGSSTQAGTTKTVSEKLEAIKLPPAPRASASGVLARLASAVAGIPGGSSRGSNSSELFLP